MKFLVVGAGVGGLLAARALQLRYPEASVIIVDRAPNVGGLLAGTTYESGLYFDQGTHIMREIGYPEIDEFLLAAVTSENVLLFEAGDGDIAGSVFNGRLQSHSHFPDIRSLADRSQLADSLKTRAYSASPIAPIVASAPLIDVANDRFGSRYACDVLLPTLSNVYKRPASDLAGFAMQLPGLTRVIAVDQVEWLAGSQNAGFRAIVGCPDQRQLPPVYRQPLRSFYSRRNGSKSFIDAVASELERSGVQIHLATRIENLDLDRGSFTLAAPGDVATQQQVDGIVLATGVFGAAQLLGLDLGSFGFDRPLAHSIVNVVLDEPSLSDLFYFYGLDPDVDFYRVTNYRAFCGDSSDRRLSIEVLGERGIEREKLVGHIIKQLCDLNIVRNTKIEFSHVHVLPSGFPSPTVRNMRALQSLGSHLIDRLPPNVMLGGIGARPGLFFQNDIVKDIYERAYTFVG